MFAARIRSTAFAIAGLALTSTSLLAPYTAAAAPITQPVTDTEAVIKLARADIRVQPSNKTGSGGQVTYKFLVTNAGPDDIRFHVRTRAYFHDPASSHMQSQDFETDLNLQNGKSVELAVACNAPGNVCYSGHLNVDKVFGIDPDMTNNYKIIHTN